MPPSEVLQALGASLTPTAPSGCTVDPVKGYTVGALTRLSQMSVRTLHH